MDDQQPERRVYQRFPIQVNVRIEFTGMEFTASSANLSAGGVFLETQRRLPVGTRLRLRFQVPVIAKYPIRAVAEVVWIGTDPPLGLAVRFIEITDDDRELLGELSEKYDSLFGEG